MIKNVTSQALQAQLQSITETHKILKPIFDEEQNYFDNRSKAWQESDEGEEYEEKLEAMEEILEELTSMRDSINFILHGTEPDDLSFSED